MEACCAVVQVSDCLMSHQRGVVETRYFAGHRSVHRSVYASNCRQSWTSICSSSNLNTPPSPPLPSPHPCSPSPVESSSDAPLSSGSALASDKATKLGEAAAAPVQFIARIRITYCLKEEAMPDGYLLDKFETAMQVEARDCQYHPCFTIRFSGR